MSRTANWSSLLAVGLVACCLAVPDATAQSSLGPRRIGWLSHGVAPAKLDSVNGDFEQALRDAGYVDRKSVEIVYRYADGDIAQLPVLAAELVRLHVDVIVTSGEPAAFAAKRVTTTTPIVATEFGLDPVKAGLVVGLARPGANITGLATISDELWQKRLGLLKETAPRVASIAIVSNPSNPGNVECLAEIMAVAHDMGLRVRSVELRERSRVERATTDIAREMPDALVLCWDSLTLENAKPIAEFALRHRLPILVPLREYVDAGALLSFGTSLAAHRRRAAHYVDEILKGVKPGSLPVERPTNFELVVKPSE